MFDTMIIGQITLDHNIDFDGREEFINGGAVTGIVDARNVTKEEVGLLMTKTDTERKEEVQ